MWEMTYHGNSVNNNYCENSYVWCCRLCVQSEEVERGRLSSLTKLHLKKLISWKNVHKKKYNDQKPKNKKLNIFRLYATSVPAQLWGTSGYRKETITPGESIQHMTKRMTNIRSAIKKAGWDIDQILTFQEKMWDSINTVKVKK